MPTAQNAPAVLAIHVRDVAKHLRNRDLQTGWRLGASLQDEASRLEGIAEQLDQLATHTPPLPDPAGGR